jgi:hypothetical protein
MTANTAKQQLISTLTLWKNVAPASFSVCVSFMAYDKKTGGIDFHKLSLDNQLTDMFKGIGVECIHTTLDRLTVDSLGAFNSTIPTPSGELPYIDLTQSTLSLDLVKLDDLNALPLYNHKKFPRTKLHGYVITLEDNTLGKAHFLAKYNSKKELTRGKNILSKVLVSNQFDAVTEPLFLFDKHIDCFIIDNKSLILEKRKFLTLFKFHEAIKQEGVNAARQVIRLIQMTNSAEFVADCEKDMRALIKLNNIRQQPNFNTLSIAGIEAIKAKGFPVDLEIDLTNYTPGLYVLEVISTDNQRSIHKIVKK